MTDSDDFYLLSIDGGGMRGIVPAQVLAEIERRTRASVSELFDAIAGTSTGGILALALSRRGKDGAPLFAARDLIEMYTSNGQQIFSKRGLRGFFDRLVERSPFLRQRRIQAGIPMNSDFVDLFAPKYSPAGRLAVMRKYLEGSKLSEAATRLFIPSYDTQLRIPVFFVSRGADAEDNPLYRCIHQNVSMVDAAMATSAAPTYFPPHRLDNGTYSPEDGFYSLIDGGVFAINPAILANAFLNRSGKRAFIVSLGTASMSRSYPYGRARRWGAKDWAAPLLEIVADSGTESVACALAKLLPAGDFVRLQPALTTVTEDMDDASAENLSQLREIATRLIEENDELIDSVCARLAARLAQRRRDEEAGSAGRALSSTSVLAPVAALRGP
jgi:predicted acylesterase/phospholipase RssA